MLGLCWAAGFGRPRKQCGRKVDPNDSLGLCRRHREELLDEAVIDVEHEIELDRADHMAQVASFGVRGFGLVAAGCDEED